MDKLKLQKAAVEYKHNGYNCCQSVLLAYSDYVGVDRSILMYVASGFGMGMGCMEATCGSLAGAVIAAGLLKKGEKTTLVSKQILKKFEEKSGATVCKILKGIETGKTLTPCDDCVRNAVESLLEVMELEKV